MFPWFRLIRVGLGSISEPKVDLLATTRVRLRAWPNDLDLNLHVNNGRYLSLADIGRIVIGVVGIRGVFKGPGGPVDPAVFLAGLSHAAPSPVLPEWANRFHQGSELLSELLRDEEHSKGLRTPTQ